MVSAKDWIRRSRSCKNFTTCSTRRFQARSIPANSGKNVTLGVVDWGLVKSGKRDRTQSASVIFSRKLFWSQPVVVLVLLVWIGENDWSDVFFFFITGVDVSFWVAGAASVSMDALEIELLLLLLFCSRSFKMARGKPSTLSKMGGILFFASLLSTCTPPETGMVTVAGAEETEVSLKAGGDI